MKGLDQALRITWAALNGEENLTKERIKNEVEILYPTVLKRYFDNSRSDEEIQEIIIRHTEEQFAIWITGEAVAIDDTTETHTPWLENRKGDIEWDFWNRYVDYLSFHDRWNQDSLEGLDETTNRILGRLEDPKSAGPWDRRGMIVGEVQSGKTANFIGVVNKAIDSGYKLIIVLAGLNNDLRSQTQERINEGVLGYDAPPDAVIDHTRPKKRTGVGLLPSFKEHNVATLTSSDETGDFNIKILKQGSVYPGQVNLILVVKKNASVLKNLKSWIESTPWAKETESGKYLENVPLLVIDDEADNGSINTINIYDENGNIDPEYDVTKINGLIRQILMIFGKSSYVGYTATPFANIFIDPESDSEKFGRDLFPRSFIISLPVPSDYIGPEKIFGLGDDSDPESVQNAEHSLVCTIDDYRTIIPDFHKKDLVITQLPPSLIRAIRFFILSIAGRAARGDDKVHISMLVHVTRFIDVQNQISKLIAKEVRELQQRLRYGEGNYPNKIEDELREIWETEFVPVSTTMKTRGDDLDKKFLKWDEVHRHLVPSVMKIQIIVSNGSSKDSLNYRQHEKEGLCAIIIGGDKLSRGLTLRGLTTSYYLRASRMYDTLMQMGRWFGYRPGYLDLCRIFTSDELKDWYGHIAKASKELREEFIYMHDRGMTPMQYGLRVRTHPDSLIITSLNKMRSGMEVRISYSGTISECVVYHNSQKIIDENNRNYSIFVNSLKNPKHHTGNKEYFQWDDIPGEKITELFGNIHTHVDSLKADSALIQRYISARLKDEELKNWTVILLSGGDGDRWGVGNFSVKNMKRTRSNSGFESEGIDKITIQRLVSPRDEWLDLSQSEQNEILEKTRKEYEKNPKRKGNKIPSNPSGILIRKKRTEKGNNGLLLLYPLDLTEKTKGGEISKTKTLGFAVSFPFSKTTGDVSYRVNRVYWDNEIRS